MSRMKGGRALSVHEHIGGYQYRLRIQNTQAFNLNQWFVFDSRTKSIRSYTKRTYAISNQSGYQNRPRYAVVIRQWKGESYQKISYHKGTKRNLRNTSGFCMDVVGHKDVHRQHLHFWPCHNGDNQGWSINTQGIHFPRYPLRDGQRFQIKSQMKTNRALFWKEHIGGQQYRLRIRTNDPENNRQWFIFDWRTRSIRAMADRKKAISIQTNGKNWFYNAYAAVIRQHKNEQIQKIRWFSGDKRNIRDQGIRCLDVHGASNTENRHVHWYKCHNGANQGWTIDTKGIKYPAYPLKDGVKFQIRSKMSGFRALHITEHIGGHQYRLRIRDNSPYDHKQYFTFDSRTHTIRAFYSRTQALSVQAGQGFRNGVAGVMRKFLRQSNQYMQWHEGSRRNIRHNQGRCLDVHGGSNTHNRHVIWWNCHNGLNQGWTVDQNGPQYNKHPIADGIKFQIRSKMAGNRAIYHHWTHIGSSQYRLYIRNHLTGEDRQWFTFDRRT
jgi:hypothetical protein